MPRQQTAVGNELNTVLKKGAQVQTADLQALVAPRDELWPHTPPHIAATFS